MTRNHSITVVFLLLCLVFSAGCNYRLQSDLFIVKLYGNGTFAWIKVIDSGVGTSIVETSDGGYLVTGGSLPTTCGNSHKEMVSPFLVRLSPQGNVERIENYSYGIREGMLAVFPKPDGSMDAISESGIILTLDQRGKLIQNTTTVDKKISGVLRTSDNGYLMADSYWKDNSRFCRFSKTDMSGSLQWTQDVRDVGCDGRYLIIESEVPGTYLAGPMILQENASARSVSMVTLDSRNFSLYHLDETRSLFNPILISGMFPRNHSIEFIHNPHNTGTLGIIDIYPAYSTTFPDSPPSIRQQNIIRFYRDGNVDTNRTIKDLNGRIFFETDDGIFLSIYEQVKGGAAYFRLVKTSADGSLLWDKPFLTLRYRPAPTDFHETVTIKQIIPTVDDGYVILGLWQKSSDC